MHPRPEHIKMQDGAGVAALRLRPSSRWGSKRKARRQAQSLRVRRARTKGEEGGKKETGCGAEPLPCCFSPATRPAPTLARCWPAPVEGGELSHRLWGVAEVESGGSGACSTHADFTKARHPSQRKPNPSKPNKGKEDLQKPGR